MLEKSQRVEHGPPDHHLIDEPAQIQAGENSFPLVFLQHLHFQVSLKFDSKFQNGTIWYTVRVTDLHEST